MATSERTPVPGQLTGSRGPDATNSQVEFIITLLGQRDLMASEKFAMQIEGLSEEQTEQFIANMSQQAQALTKSQASEWITRLKALPYKKTKREAAQAPSVPEGHYALEYEGDDLNPIRFYKVSHGKDLSKQRRPDGTMGKNWEGYIFVDRYSSDDTFPVRGKERYRVLEHIATDPLRSAQLYGQHYKRCCICNRGLTRKLSRELGIGPVCGARVGWLNEAMVEVARATIAARGEDPDEEV